MKLNGPVSKTTPAVVLTDVSGRRGTPPRSPATGEFEGMVPLFTRSPSAGSKMVEMLNPFCCPGVGARNPVLTLARTKPARAETLPLVVVPKSSKFSMRTADPKVQPPSGSFSSRSP